MAWLYFSAAIATEVTGTVALKYADGFSKKWPSLVVAVAYGVSLYLLT